MLPPFLWDTIPVLIIFLGDAAHISITVRAIKEVTAVVGGVKPLNKTFGVSQLKYIFVSNGSVDRLGEGPLNRIQQWLPSLVVWSDGGSSSLG